MRKDRCLIFHSFPFLLFARVGINMHISGKLITFQIAPGLYYYFSTQPRVNSRRLCIHTHSTQTHGGRTMSSRVEKRYL